MKAKALLSLLFAMGISTAQADPLSAVDWLSEILETPQETVPETPSNGTSIETIETMRLSDVQKDTVGILPSQVSGIPSDFWGDSSVDRLAALIRNAPTGQLPEITALWRRIMLAELNPPIVVTEENKLLMARLDALLTAGDLNPAEALLKAADPDNPQLFRRWFDVSILTQRATEACSRMVSTPRFAPTLQARVFCLARSGDWKAASITLNTAKALSKISKDEAALFGMFLDPELYNEEPSPPIPTILTPLNFVTREALALPRPAQSLPLAFLHMDLQNKAGWKLRITSAERLARENAIPSVALLDLYLEGSPSASGGVWERVKAVQELVTALNSSDDVALSDALINAHDALSPLDLQAALSEWFAPALAGRMLTAQAKRIGFELAVLNTNAYDLVFALASTSQIEQIVISILSDRFNAPPHGNLQQAIYNALAGYSSKTVLHQTVDDGRLGEAVLSALTLLHDGPQSDVGDIEVALSVLSYGGFRSEAKRIATQLLLL
jgi:hypothetical protein